MGCFADMCLHKLRDYPKFLFLSHCLCGFIHVPTDAFWVFLFPVLPEQVFLWEHSVYRPVGSPTTGWYNFTTRTINVLCLGRCTCYTLLLSSVCCQAVEKTPGLHIPHTVHDIMNRWTLQMGYPVVTIDTRTGRVTQKHFLLDPDSVVDRHSQFK